MQFSESWLRQYVNPSLDSDALGHAMTMAGLEVEEQYSVAPPFSKIVVAQILSAEQHPDADRLIENGNFNNNPSMKYILKALRKKPMTDEEIKDKGKFSERALTWVNAGVRLAEKHHGITED